MSAILRRSAVERGSRDKYQSRFAPLLEPIFDLLTKCPPADHPRIKKVLDLWWNEGLFSPVAVDRLQKRFAGAGAPVPAATAAGGEAARETGSATGRQGAVAADTSLVGSDAADVSSASHGSLHVPSDWTSQAASGGRGTATAAVATAAVAPVSSPQPLPLPSQLPSPSLPPPPPSQLPPPLLPLPPPPPPPPAAVATVAAWDCLLSAGDANAPYDPFSAADQQHQEQLRPVKASGGMLPRPGVPPPLPSVSPERGPSGRKRRSRWAPQPGDDDARQEQQVQQQQADSGEQRQHLAEAAPLPPPPPPPPLPDLPMWQQDQQQQLAPAAAPAAGPASPPKRRRSRWEPAPGAQPPLAQVPLPHTLLARKDEGAALPALPAQDAQEMVAAAATAAQQEDGALPPGFGQRVTPLVPPSLSPGAREPA